MAVCILHTAVAWSLARTAHVGVWI